LIISRILLGQVEPGEDVQATAVRELEEESGLVACTENLQKVGHFQYEFSDTNILPCIMEVSDAVLRIHDILVRIRMHGSSD
jgi:8-oxo-dGTP pyrophosphatase MutT (NUDIX family)